MATLAEIAQERADLVTNLTTSAAYTDPGKAHANRPCLLFAPPTVDWSAGSLAGDAQVRWRLIALSSYDAGTFEALNELEVLLEAAAGVLDVETAEPIQYAMNGNTRVAAYLLTLTT